MFQTRKRFRHPRTLYRAWLTKPVHSHCSNLLTRFARQAAVPVALLVLALTAPPGQAALTLPEAERLALADDPFIAASQARAQALGEAAIADGQLPDPSLKAGISNLPLDTLDIDQEPMTQLVLGLQQAFPRGNTLRYRQRQTEWDATSEQARAEDNTRKVIRDTRISFLELYYQNQAHQIVGTTRDLFAQLVNITQAHYGSGSANQQDVLSAALELSRLDDRATGIRNQEEQFRAALMKWIGEAARQPVDAAFPGLPALPGKTALEAALEQHPAIRIETAQLESRKQGIRIAREQYKPGWNVGLEYRERFGDNPDGSDRPDMMAAMVSVDLPLFTEKRQDRRLAASQQQSEAARLVRADRMRELRESLESEYANWQRLGERQALYETRLLREADANAIASLKAYQSGVTEFTTLMRARITELDVRLQDLRVRVDRAKAQARLLYLAGENQ